MPSDAILGAIFDTCYQASLLREEGRLSSFSIIYYSKSTKLVTNRARRAFQFTWGMEPIVRFDLERKFSVGEINKLAPVANAERCMICVGGKSRSRLRIWGLLDTGDSWRNLALNGVYANSTIRPPPDLTVSSLNSGELIVSSAGEVLLSLDRGKIIDASGNTLRSKGLSDFFIQARTKLYFAACTPFGQKKYDPEGDDDDYPNRIYDTCIARILNGIQDGNHGGTLVVVPDKYYNDDQRLLKRMRIKYPCTYDHLWKLLVADLVLKRTHDLFDSSLSKPGNTTTSTQYIMASEFRRRSEANQELIANCCRAISALCNVDGAVVITDRFRVLGFGAEVTVAAPKLKSVKIRRMGSTTPSSTSIENYGTRHRSAFRFCSSFKDSIAFVISQDGGIKAVKNCQSKVFMWPDVSTLMPMRTFLVGMSDGKLRIFHNGKWQPNS